MAKTKSQVTNEIRMSRLKCQIPGLWILTLLAVALSGCLNPGSAAAKGRASDYASGHGRMMLKIEEAGVRDALVLDAMKVVPPQEFASGKPGETVFPDVSVSPDPVLFARMVDLLGLKGKEKVLQVGTGSGYQAAVLSRIAKHVYTVEIMPGLAGAARERFSCLGCANISVRCADPAAGWEEHAPFDAILSAEPFSKIPQALVNQLREGGRMIVAEGATLSEETVRHVTKAEGVVIVEDAFSSPPVSAPVEQGSENRRKESEE